MAGDDEFDFTEEARITNEKLAGDIAKLSPLQMEEIRKCLPTRVDQERFEEIIKIVNGAQSKNEKLAALRTNIEGLGGAVVSIIKAAL